MRAGFGGAYALDWQVIMKAAHDMGIRRNYLFYRALKIFESAMISKMNEKQSHEEG